MARQRNTKTSPRVIARTAKVRKAIELRMAGWSLEEIAVQCGWHSRQAVHAAILVTLQRDQAETVEQYRVYELARLDTLLRGIWEAACDGNLDCVDRVIKIMQQRLRYLSGLEVPTKVAPTSPDGQTPYEPPQSFPPDFSTQVASILAEFGQLAGTASSPTNGYSAYSTPAE